MKTRSISFCGIPCRKILVTTLLAASAMGTSTQADTVFVTNTLGDTSAGSLGAAAVTGVTPPLPTVDFRDLDGGDIDLQGAAVFTTGSATTFRFSGNTTSLTISGADLVLNSHLYLDLAVNQTFVLNSDVEFTTGANVLLVEGGGTAAFNGDLSDVGLLWVQEATATIGSATGPASMQLDDKAVVRFAISNSYNSAIELDGTATIHTGASNVTLSGVVSSFGSNGLVKAGSGTLTLTGTNTYSGATRIDAGTLSVASDSNLGGGAVALNGGNLTVTGSTTINNAISLAANGTISNSSAVTLSGVLSGTGNLTKSGAGTLTLAGTNTYSGGTIVNAGTLQISSDGNLGSGALTLNGGNLTVTGTTNIDNGIALASSATLTNTSGVTLSGAISGTGGLTKAGAGTLTLSGVNTYSGATTVDAGLLAVNGSIANSSTTVSAGGTLGGSGTVGSVTVNGAVAPGNSIGTLNVSGNVDFSGGGVYKVEVNDAGGTDLISATGSATLTNGTVEVAPEAGTYSYSTDYTILTAAGGLGGTTFDSVSSSLAFLTPTLTYDASNVFLNLTRNDTKFENLARTPNQRAVALTLTDLSGSALKEISDNIVVLTGPGARQAYDSLSGVQLTYGGVAAHQAMDRFRRVLFNHVQGASEAGNAAAGLTGTDVMMAYHDDGAIRGTSSSAYPWQGEGVFSSGGLWLEGLGGISTIESTANAEGADIYSGGLAAGLDARLGDFTVGVAGSYLAANVDTDTGGNDVGSYQLAGYGLWQRDTLYANAALSLGVHATDTSRDVTVGSLSRTARADYTSTGFGLALEAGKSFALVQRTSITPYAGIAYEFLRQDAFEETGAGSMNLSVDEDISNGLRVTLGTRLQHLFKSRDGLALVPYIDLAYVHDASGTAQMDTAFAVAPDTAFSIEGADLDRNRARLGVGATGYLNENTSLNVAYQGEFSASDQQHNLSAAIKFRW